MAAHFSARRILHLLLTLLVVSLFVPPFLVSAATPAFRGEYYNNRTLSGTPALVRDDAAINFAWGSGAPAAGIGADNFSVRWTNFVYFAAGTYRFTVCTDDGARLYVDEALIVDRWVEQPPTTVVVDRALAAGYHSIRLEYFEAGGGAVAQLSWAQVGSGDTYPQWKGEYFNNVDLSGTPAVTRNDVDINFNWGYNAPAAGINADNFSVRWTRQVSFATAGPYVFTATSDDGIRVKVDGALVIDRWVDQAPTTVTGSITLNAGTHTVMVEYYERGGTAVARLTWTGAGSSATIVVDDLDPGFVIGGNPGNLHAQAWGYKNHLYWMWNNKTAVYTWARWVPKLPAAGNYEVQVYIASRWFGSRSATYRIDHNGTRNWRTISQAVYSNQWVSLGTYYFNAGGWEYVFLAGATGEPYATTHLGFDAVRFIGKGGGTSPTPPPGSTPTPPAACSIMPVLGFGNVWNNNATVRSCLGCPTQTEKSTWMAEQKFVGGLMFWRQDNDVIYVLQNNGTWQQFPNTWHAGDPETDPSLTPPSGYYQPRRGFGKLWRENGVVHTQLGWATMEERGFTGAVEPFERGLMLWSPQLGVFVLCNDGTWKRY